MNTMMSELAVYASLFLTIFVGGFLGGFSPANSKYINLRAGFDIGLCIGICCFMFAAAYVIGEPRNDSSDCNFQAISSKLFSLAGFAWEAAIC